MFFLHRHFFTHTRTHTHARACFNRDVFKRTRFYTEIVVHRNTFTQRCFHTEMVSHTETLLHRDDLTRSSFTHRYHDKQRCFYKRMDLHEELLYTDVFTQAYFCMISDGRCKTTKFHRRCWPWVCAGFSRTSGLRISDSSQHQYPKGPFSWGIWGCSWG